MLEGGPWQKGRGIVVGRGRRVGELPRLGCEGQKSRGAVEGGERESCGGARLGRGWLCCNSARARPVGGEGEEEEEASTPQEEEDGGAGIMLSKRSGKGREEEVKKGA